MDATPTVAVIVILLIILVLVVAATLRLRLAQAGTFASAIIGGFNARRTTHVGSTRVEEPREAEDEADPFDTRYGGEEEIDELWEEGPPQAEWRREDRHGGAERPWTEYATWDELEADPGAARAYADARRAARRRPGFEWAGVAAALGDKLAEPREYAGVINAGADGRTLEVAACEAGPEAVEGDANHRRGVYASIPSELHGRVTSRPALYEYHTHPEGAWPMPSPSDICSTLALGVAKRYAGSVIVSRWGALVYGLSEEGQEAYDAADDKEVALANLQFDVPAAYEAVRSWSAHTLDDLLSFFSEHHMYAYVVPTGDYVGRRAHRMIRDLEAFTDYEPLLKRLRRSHDLMAPAAATGGAPDKKPRTANPYPDYPECPPLPAKPAWARHETWASLRGNKAAYAAYASAAASARRCPNFDWSDVLTTLGPKLAEPREYVGVLSTGADGRKLQVVTCVASPAGGVAEGPAEKQAYAHAPASLIAAAAARPGLFLYHTHPRHENGWPLPSSADLAGAIHHGALGLYAADVVVTAWGVFVYGLGDEARERLAQARNPQLALANLMYDVVAAHEATRSRTKHTFRELLAFYPRHGLFVHVYPSPEFLGRMNDTMVWSLTAPIHYSLVNFLMNAAEQKQNK
jgi:hypothetical protein